MAWLHRKNAEERKAKQSNFSKSEWKEEFGLHRPPITREDSIEKPGQKHGRPMAEMKMKSEYISDWGKWLPGRLKRQKRFEDEEEEAALFLHIFSCNSHLTRTLSLK